MKIANNFELMAILLWTVGLWSSGIGVRLSYELITRGHCNVTGILWFDWIPLTVLGIICLFLGLRFLYLYLEGEKLVR